MNLGIIQARTGSTRFPNKILYKIKDRTLLELFIERVEQSKLLDQIIVATTTNPNDDGLYNLIKSWGINCFRGSEDDLIDRYYKCAKKYGAKSEPKNDVVVRLGSDDVFVDPDIIDRAITLYNDNPTLDFITNHFEPTYPEGLELELYPIHTLEYLWTHTKLKSDREHVFIYLYNNKDKFNIYNFKQVKNESHIRLTMDYECDFTLTKLIYEYWGDQPNIPKHKDIVKIIEEHPELKYINNDIKRKEGINKSIAKDNGRLIDR